MADGFPGRPVVLGDEVPGVLQLEVPVPEGAGGSAQERPQATLTVSKNSREASRDVENAHRGLFSLLLQSGIHLAEVGVLVGVVVREGKREVVGWPMKGWRV